MKLHSVVLTVMCTAILGALHCTSIAQVVGYAGGGVIQAGDVWESFLPQGFVPNYSDATTNTTLGWRTFLRMGNFDRNWTTPATHWPAAYPMTPYWFKNAMVFVYDNSSTFNPATIGGTANPSYFAAARPAGSSNSWSNFAQLTYSEKLAGAVAQVGTSIKTGARNFSKAPYWRDGTTRQHQVYEAGWPTNVGIDVKLRAHGFQGPNWDNLNDFVLVEIELKNTGVVDMNMDGVAEQINHDIQALAFQVSGQAYMSVSSYGGGTRNVNDIVPNPIARQACWIDDADENGAPWAFTFYRAAPTSANPSPGNWDFGFNGGSTKNYTDIYTGWVMIDAKTGGLPADPKQSTSTLPSKTTIFGTHPIGTGAQRGWFVSGQSTRFGYTTGNPMQMFYATTAAFYTDCGRLFSTASFDSYNLGPNTNLFSNGTAGDPLTFVTKPQGQWSRPDGSMQAAGAFDQVSTEDGKADATTDYPAGYGKFSAGASHTENFDGDSYSGIGPFSLKKDSVMTLVFATVAGYRLEGIQKAVRAARWTYEHDFAIPALPPLPDLKATDLKNGSIAVEWDNTAETASAFAGFKIWRATNKDTSAYLDEGLRVADRYQEQSSPGPRPDAVFKPVNPKFDAFAKTLGNATHGTYAPDTWGTWTLQKTIMKNELPALPPATSAGFAYAWTDTSLVDGGSYWYYVSAFTQGTYTGPGGDTTSSIETHSANRNGASGLWIKTYPFAPLNANYPVDSLGRKAIGAAVMFRKPTAVDGDAPAAAAFRLFQNYPNPFNPTTVIRYQVPAAMHVEITVYDLLGRVVANLVNARRDAGEHQVMFDGSGLAAGVYFYSIRAGSHVQTNKLLLIR